MYFIRLRVLSTYPYYPFGCHHHQCLPFHLVYQDVSDELQVFSLAHQEPVNSEYNKQKLELGIETNYQQVVSRLLLT